LNRNVLFILALVVVGFGAASYKIYSTSTEEQTRAESALALAQLQNRYLERIGWIRANPDDAQYRTEVNAFLEDYFKHVDEHLKTWGDDTTAYEKELASKADAKDYAQRKAIYDQVKQTYALLKSGKYKPVWTATDKGMRLDVVSDDVMGDKVRFELLLWGAQREMHEETASNGLQHIKRMVTSATFSVHWKLSDAKGKLVGEMDASGDPSMKIDYPERYIPEFPPMIITGHYDMDKVPANVKTMEVTFTVNSQSPSGGTANATYAWKMDVPSDWKLGDGAAWSGATETTRDLSEIDPSHHKK
jgi:hypothetical protein